MTAQHEEIAVNGIRRILIINGKGGCGKSTIATNLAVSYCERGHRTALMDYDSQASSTDWAELRKQSADDQPSNDQLNND